MRESVTGFTAGRMLDIEQTAVVEGEVVGDDLHLTRKNGSTFNAGRVRGNPGAMTYEELSDLTEAQIADGVPPLVAEQIASANPEIAAQAAALAQSDAGLVRNTDVGVARPVNDDQNYAWVFRSKVGRRLLAAFTSTGNFRIFRGLDFGSVSFTTANDPTYAHGSTGLKPAGRSFKPLAEDAYLLNGTKPQWVLDRWRARMGLADIVVPVAPTTTIVVRPNPGAGEYATPWEANAAILDSSKNKPYIIKVFPGEYLATTSAQLNWTVKAHVSIIGTERDACIIKGVLPDNASDSDITTFSTLQVKDTAALKNLTITARNLRYTVHSESGGTITDYTHVIDNCTMIHYGNLDAENWRTANPGSGLTAANVWKYPSVWGYGASSGGKEYFYNSKFLSGMRVWYIHDRENWSKGGEHIIDGCEFYSWHANPNIDLEALGSGVETTVNISNSSLNALAVQYNDSPWITELPENQVANHAQIRAVIGGQDPIGFRTSCRGRALKIESTVATAASTVRVTGTAADALMGLVIKRDLGWGVKGYAFGRWDISGILVGLNSNVAVNNTMGKRLGNCSVVSKTMAVVINGAAPINVTFNADYTAASDATILGVINTALGSAGVASVYDVVGGEEYASFPDRETALVNRGATTIPRWSAVKRTNNGGVALMETGDLASDFLGVTLEPITPGWLGRILTQGRLQSVAGQIKGVTGTIALGAPVYLSDTVAGEFSTTGTRQVMTGTHSAGWAEFA